MGGKEVKIDLQHCKHCGTYFIDRQSLAIYEKKYGRLRINYCPMEAYVRRVSARKNEDMYAPDSILSRNGYLTKYDEKQRRKALTLMMYNGISKAEIKGKLSEFIDLRGKKCYMAVKIWRDDLEFVNDCNLEDEEQVFFLDRKSK